MLWYKKTFPRFGAEWAADQDRIADLQLRIAADGTDTYRKLMMVSVEEDAELPETEDVYLRLPDVIYARLFPGYEHVVDGPTRVSSFLVGDQVEFDRLFRQQRAGSAF